HDFFGQAERLGVEGRVAFGLAAQRIEPRGEMTVRPERLQQRGCRLHRLEHLLVGGSALGNRRLALLDRREARGGRRWRERRGSGGRGRWKLRKLDSKIPEHPFVEAVLAA